MERYIVSKQEREGFAAVLRKRTVSPVTCQGSRCIGNSRLIEEWVQTAGHFLIHSGQLDPSIEPSDYFDHILNADELVAG